MLDICIILSYNNYIVSYNIDIKSHFFVYVKSNDFYLAIYNGGCRLIGQRLNVSCSETLSKCWTPTAVDCYNIGCMCSRCNLYKIYFQGNISKCRMKETVIELVRLIGAPDKNMSSDFVTKRKGGKYERLY